MTHYVSELLGDSRFVALLDMLNTEHPKNWRPAPGAEPQQHTHTLRLGEIYGYDQCIETIMDAARLSLPQKPLQATFDENQLNQP